MELATLTFPVVGYCNDHYHIHPLCSVPHILEGVPILTLDCNPEFESDKEQTRQLIKEVNIG